MADWTPPTPLVTQALIDRITASAALQADTSSDTPPQRDMRNLLAFVSYAMIAAKESGDQAVLGLFDPAMTNIELP